MYSHPEYRGNFSLLMHNPSSVPAISVYRQHFSVYDSFLIFEDWELGRPPNHFINLKATHHSRVNETFEIPYIYVHAAMHPGFLVSSELKDAES